MDVLTLTWVQVKYKCLPRAKTLFNKFKDGDPGLPAWEPAGEEEEGEGEPQGEEEEKEGEEPEGGEEEEEVGNKGAEQQEAEPRKEAEEGGRGGG